MSNRLQPKGIELRVRLIHSGDPIVVRTDNRYIQAATRALHQVFGKETVFIRSGGSIPIVGDFERHLKIPTVMMGFGLPDDNLHAPMRNFTSPIFTGGSSRSFFCSKNWGGSRCWSPPPTPRWLRQRNQCCGASIAG